MSIENPEDNQAKMAELLGKAKESVSSLMAEINEKGRTNSAAQNVSRVYSSHIADPLREMVGFLKVSDQQKASDVEALAGEIEGFSRNIGEEMRKREGVKVADEFEKLLKKVESLEI